MQSTRQNKICSLIQKDMGDIFLREMKPVLGPSLITVTRVRITPDLSIARIHVSIMVIGEGTPESILALIRENTPDLRRRLGLREGKQLRIIPHLEFYLDDSLDYIENIERLLKNLKLRVSLLYATSSPASSGRWSTSSRGFPLWD